MTAGGGAAAADDSPAPGSATEDGGSAQARTGRSSRSQSSAEEPGVANGGAETNDNGAPLGSDTKKGGDNSIETYGSVAEGSERAAAIEAMRSFVTAIGARDFNTVCTSLSSKIVRSLGRPNETCPELLESLVIISAAEARASATGAVTHVRIGGDNAFVLFRPAGSSRLDYFVMTREDGEWKSLGLTVGTPLEPVAGPAG